jgi:hypothetical protein
MVNEVIGTDSVIGFTNNGYHNGMLSAVERNEIARDVIQSNRFEAKDLKAINDIAKNNFDRQQILT